MDVQIHPTWKRVLQPEFEQPYFANISAFLKAERAAGKTFYPRGSHLFNAFDSTPFEEVKVVILGQDPYHGAGQAMGLSFSVPDGVRIPPSLLNIYKELATDVGIPPATTGNLTRWTAQGVLLLNSILTVEAGKAASHQKIGWQAFTDAAIRALSDHREDIVFMLWGNFARTKRELIDGRKHCILEAAHPSPLAGNAFAGCQHFSKANAFLEEQGKTPIDWRVME